MIDRSLEDIGAIIREGTVIDRAIVGARRRVVRRHKQLGVPLVVWQDGRVVEVAPDGVAIPDRDSGSQKDR